MLTTNRPYDLDFYRRSGQAMNLVLRNQALEDDYGSPTYASHRDTSVPDLEGKPSGTHRKRVPVACERCRKRKIKCSGDQGDGSGCDNCKSAGYDGCQFLRVHSKELKCPQTYNAPRWHAHHYHPYSRSHNANQAHQAHQAHQAQQAQQYAQQHASPYSTWQGGLEYSGLPTVTSNGMSWNSNHYPSTYQMYDAEHASPYSAHPPSYMLPDPAHGPRPEMSYLASLPRPQHNSIWLESVNSASVPQQHSQIVSPVYPLTPAESTKSYSVLSQPPHVNLSYERNLPIPSLATIHQTLPSQGRETPPLSAISHRSSHTWTTDSASNVSAASSRTSCGGSQDFTAAAQALTNCEDQAAVYTYQTNEASSQLDDPLSTLPTTSEVMERQSESQQTTPTSPVQEVSAEGLHTRVSHDSLRISSPIVYGYPRRSSSRRPHNVFPPRLMTMFNGSALPVGWNQSPSSASSRHNSSSSQTIDHGEYGDEHDRGSETLLTSIY